MRVRLGAFLLCEFCLAHMGFWAWAALQIVNRWGFLGCVVLAVASAAAAFYWWIEATND